MFGFRYVKSSPSQYLLQYRNGRVVREGTGLAFWYFAATVHIGQRALDLGRSAFHVRRGHPRLPAGHAAGAGHLPSGRPASAGREPELQPAG